MGDFTILYTPHCIWIFIISVSEKILPMSSSSLPIPSFLFWKPTKKNIGSHPANETVWPSLMVSFYSILLPLPAVVLFEERAENCCKSLYVFLFFGMFCGMHLCKKNIHIYLYYECKYKHGHPSSKNLCLLL